MTNFHINVPIVTAWLALSLSNGGDPQSTPGIVRIHDLTAARPVVDQHAEEGAVLLPLSTSPSHDGVDVPQGETARDPDVLVDLLRTMNSAMWESEGRELSSLGGARLYVRAPAADQESIARQLAFFEDTFGRPTRLVFDFATFSPNPGVENLPALLPASDVQRWVDIAISHERQEIALLPGERQGVVAERVVTLATTFPVQIAGRTAGYEAAGERVRVGTRIDTATAPTRGGLWLALNLREGRLIGGVETREQLLTATLLTDPGVHALMGPRTRDDVRLANHSLSVNAFLPDGKALAFQTNVGLETHVVFVRQEGGPTPTTIRLPDDLKRAVSMPETVLMRVDGLAPPVARLDRSAEHGAELGACFAAIDPDRGPVLTSALAMSRVDECVNWLQSASNATSIHTTAWFVPTAASKDEIEPQLALFAQLNAEPRPLQVRFALRKGLRDTTVLARGLVPIRADECSTLVLGKESLATTSAAVEVAESSSAPIANVARLFDGVVVQLSPHAMSNGGLTVVVDAHARWSRAALRSFDAGTATLPKLQMQDSDVLDVTRTLVFAKSEAAARRVVLGNMGNADDALTLELEIVDVR